MFSCLNPLVNFRPYVDSGSPPCSVVFSLVEAVLNLVCSIPVEYSNTNQGYIFRHAHSCLSVVWWRWPVLPRRPPRLVIYRRRFRPRIIYSDLLPKEILTENPAVKSPRSQSSSNGIVTLGRTETLSVSAKV